MPLTLILGPANAGKAAAVLRECALASRREAVLVLPSTADVRHYERELSAGGVTLTATVTFSGLLEEIARRAGYRRPRLTPRQRGMLVRRAIARARLQTLAQAASGPGFQAAAGRLLAELAQARVEPQRFASALASWAGGAGERSAYARELSAIHRRYREELERSGRVDDEMFAWGALDALRERPYSWGDTPVYVYGFDDLTPIQLDALETLARRVGAGVTVSLTYEPGRAALAAGATVAEELRAIADQVRELPASDEHYAPHARRCLHHLERWLFEPDGWVREPGEAVGLMEASGELAEGELVAAAVLDALAAGARAEEVVVVCRSLERSGELLELALERLGIRALSSRRVALTRTALGRALLALVRYALGPASERRLEDLIAFLRHPGVAGAPANVDELERRVRRQGARAEVALRGAAPELRAALGWVDELRLADDRPA
ncbi:MAG TPA: hypothetical protein VKV16_04935, partial [Solirubrobacteraceae bacterium]|nr:hypothetical protein [Solirubrobacteraceae bacterium]